jgi:hypothetical protein
MCDNCPRRLRVYNDVRKWNTRLPQESLSV